MVSGLPVGLILHKRSADIYVAFYNCASFTSLWNIYTNPYCLKTVMTPLKYIYHVCIVFINTFKNELLALLFALILLKGILCKLSTETVFDDIHSVDR